MLEELKKKVCLANKELYKLGHDRFTFGNASGFDRKENIFAIKPSGIPLDKLTPDQIVLINMDGKIVEGDLHPSTDTPTHLEIYRHFADVQAVVHTHSAFATVFAQAKKPIQCVGTTHADHFYGTIPVTSDLTDEEIAKDYETNTGLAIVQRFRQDDIDPKDVSGCLVASHGPFVWGKTIDAAVLHAFLLEEIARMNYMTLQLNPEIQPISKTLHDKHYLRKNGMRAYYGQR